MERRVQILSSYLPGTLTAALARERESAAAPRRISAPAAVLCLELQGVIERLEREPADSLLGAAAPGRLLSAVAGELVERIHEHGGDIVQLTAERLLAIWPADHEGLAGAARRAACCALGLCREPPLGDGGEALAVLAGLGAGPVALSCVGGALGRWLAVLTGAGVRQAIRAGARARAGAPAVSGEAWALLEGDRRGEPLEEGGALTGMAEMMARPARPAPLGGLRAEALAAYVPEAVLRQLERGAGGGGAGERAAALWQVTALSIRLPGLALGAADELRQLHERVRAIQEVLLRFEGSLDRLLFDGRELTLRCSLGARGDREDDAVRGARVALSIRETLRGMEQPCAIGLASGRVFCGVVGSGRRREYIMLGRTVRLAARLMQRATAGVILADDSTRRRAGDQVAFRAMGSIRLKGFREAIRVHIPVGLSSGGIQLRGGDAIPLQGRERERRVLLEGLDRLQSEGSAEVLLLLGPVGIGKSRLLSEGIREARRRGMRVLVGSGGPLERLTPYGAWAPIFGELLGGYAGAAQVLERVAASTRDAPELAALTPLLEAVLPLGLADSEATEHLAGEGRAERTRALLLHLLERCLPEKRGAVLILDEAHWLDSASLALVEAVASRLPSLYIMLGLCPREGERSGLLERLVELPRARVLAVGALEERAVSRLGARILGVSALPTTLTRYLMCRTGGEPLGLGELVRDLREAGVISVRGRRCALVAALDAWDVPAAVEAVISARVARLDPEARQVLEVVSAFGGSLTAEELRRVHPRRCDLGRIGDALEQLTRAELLQRSTSWDDACPRWDCRHSLIREVVYGEMSPEQRRALHAAVAELLEDRLQRGRSVPPAALAAHWARAGVLHKALPALERAGEAAARQDAAPEGIHFFGEALELGRGAAPQLQRFRWRLRLALLQRRLGLIEPAREQLIEALGPPAPPRHALALSAAVLGELARSAARALRRRPAGRARAALARAWLELGWLEARRLEPLAQLYATLRALGLSEERSPTGERAVARAALALIARQSGVEPIAQALSRRGLEQVQSVEDPAARGTVQQQLGLCELARARWSSAGTLLGRAGELQEATAHLEERDRCLLALSLIDGWRGALGAALERGERVISQADSRRCLLSRVRGRVLSATIRRDRGDLAGAVHLFREAAELTRISAAIDPGAELSARAGLGLALAAAGRCGAAAAVAAALHRESGLGRAARAPDSRLAELMAELSVWLWEHSEQLDELEGDQLRRQARRAVRQLTAAARRLRCLRPAAARWSGRCLYREGLWGLAERRWRAGLAEAVALGMRREEALLHAELHRAGAGLEHGRRAREILEALGLDPEAVLSAAALGSPAGEGRALAA